MGVDKPALYPICARAWFMLKSINSPAVDEWGCSLGNHESGQTIKNTAYQWHCGGCLNPYHAGQWFPFRLLIFGFNNMMLRREHMRWDGSVPTQEEIDEAHDGEMTYAFVGAGPNGQEDPAKELQTYPEELGQDLNEPLIALRGKKGLIEY